MNYIMGGCQGCREAREAVLEEHEQPMFLKYGLSRLPASLASTHDVIHIRVVLAMLPLLLRLVKVYLDPLGCIDLFRYEALRV